MMAEMCLVNGHGYFGAVESCNLCSACFFTLKMGELLIVA